MRDCVAASHERGLNVSAIKRQLNYNLLLFHVREASQEFESLLLHIRDMLGEPLHKGERELLY